MKNYVVNVSAKTSKVYLDDPSIAVDGENIAGKIIFKFNNNEFVDGVARLEWQNGTDKYFQLMEKVDKTYVLPIKNVMTKEGRMYFQLVITQTQVGDEIPVFKSNQFYVYVEKAINAEGEAPDEYATWLDTANEKIAEIDNLNITATKSGNTETITITDKQGVEHKTYVYDGEKGATGSKGEDAKINGVNTINIEAGDNITIDQVGNTLTINGQAGGGSGKVDDVLVNDNSIVEDKKAKLYLKTINNQNIIGSGNITISGGSTIQVDTMPTAGVDELGKIYQYVGNDTANYKNGYFYKCVVESSVEHIKTKLNSTIPTNIVADDNKFEYRFKVISTPNYWNVLMCNPGGGQENSALSFTNDGTIRYGFDGNYADISGHNLNDGNVHTLLYNGENGNYGLDNEIFGQWIVYEQAPITLFDVNYLNTGALMEFYELKITNKTTGDIVYDFVPALNNNTPALYDSVNQIYYYDQNNQMTYVADSTTYNWVRVETQPNDYAKSIDYNWTGYRKIEDDNFIADLQWIIKEHSNKGGTPNYWMRQYHLDNIWVNGSDESQDYTSYGLKFCGIDGMNIAQEKQVEIYTHYNSDVMYGKTDDYYYPRETNYNNGYFAYEYQLYDYLSKYNTTEYVPQSDYNPATKAYVDNVKNYALLQYTEMPIPDKANEIVQYKGTTNSNYTNGYFYRTKASAILTPILKVNTASCFYLNYQFQDTDKLEIKFRPTTPANDNGVIGNEEGSSDYMEIHFYDIRFFIGTGASQLEQNIYEQNKLYNVTINDSNGDIYVNNELFASAPSYASNGTLKLFEYGWSNDFRGEFYYLRIYDKTTGNLKKEWIPALDQNDVPCIYESVGQTYIYNVYDNTDNEYDEVADSYVWELATECLRPEIITNSETTYTIANLKEHRLYNLGEITGLDITSVDDIYLESKIYLTSGSTPTAISLPNDIVNIGDAPTFTSSGGVNSATLDSNKGYIIKILNGIAEWIKY